MLQGFIIQEHVTSIIVYVCVIIIGVFVIAGPLEVTIPFTFTLHQYYMKREAPHGEYVVTMRERMCLC